MALKDALDRARQALVGIQDEYRKGRDGDASPVQPIAPSIVPVLQRTLASMRGKPVSATPPTDAEAADVADAVRHVDWTKVSSSLKDNKAAQQMKDLAAEVDWAKAKPAAARLGTVLIAAAASGQLGPLAGPKTTLVARTLVDSGLADKVAAKLAAQPEATPESVLEFIDTTAVESVARPFTANLAALERAL